MEQQQKRCMTQLEELNDQFIKGQMSLSFFETETKIIQKKFWTKVQVLIPNHAALQDALTKKILDSKECRFFIEQLNHEIEKRQVEDSTYEPPVIATHPSGVPSSDLTVQQRLARAVNQMEHCKCSFSSWMNEGKWYKPLTKLVQTMKEKKEIVLQLSILFNGPDGNRPMSDEEYDALVKCAEEKIRSTAEDGGDEYDSDDSNC
jgi:hypothetical protein